MDKKRDIEIKIRLSADEKQQLSDKAQDIPLAVYVRKQALTDFASETKAISIEDDAEWMPKIVERYGSLDAFVEKMASKVGVNDVLKLFRWLDEKQHPFSGYVVVDISGEGVTLSKGGKQMVISEELGNGGMLSWFFDKNGVPLYNVGGVI